MRHRIFHATARAALRACHYTHGSPHRLSHPSFGTFSLCGVGLFPWKSRILWAALSRSFRPLMKFIMSSLSLQVFICRGLPPSARVGGAGRAASRRSSLLSASNPTGLVRSIAIEESLNASLPRPWLRRHHRPASRPLAVAATARVIILKQARCTISARPRRRLPSTACW